MVSVSKNKDSSFAIYTLELCSKFITNKATEHTYRSALQKYIESIDKGIEVINEPRRIKCGAPDYIISKHNIPVGYVEAKDINEDLDRVEKSDQLKRYFGSLSNLILTDYLEFRWYVNGNIRLTVKIGELNNVANKVLYLASSVARFETGNCYNIDGGITRSIL